MNRPVLLLNPPFVPRFNRTGCRWSSRTRSDTCCYPFWLADACGYLEQNGIECKLVDAPAKKLTFNQVRHICFDFYPDILVVDTSTPSIKSDVQVASTLKKNLGCTTVLVGPHASALPKETLEMDNEIDYVIQGEYDITLLKLAQQKRLYGRKVIQGEPLKDLDKLPFEAETYKKHLNIKDYFFSLARYPEIQIKTFSRGCPYSCIYCCWVQTLTGRNVRYGSVEKTVDELEYIKIEFPQVKDVIFEDDTFTVDHKRVTEVCKEIKYRDLNIDWICNARADVPLAIMKEMKHAGCRMLIVGYESANQEILDRAKKGIKVETMLKFARNAKKVGLQTMGCFMLGLPGESPETARQTFEFAKEVDPDFYFFSPATPFAGTEFYEICKREGYLVAKDWSEWTDEEGYLRNVVSYPNFSNEEISKTIDEFLWKFAFRPKFIGKSLKKVIRHPITEGSRFLRSFVHGVKYYYARHLANR